MDAAEVFISFHYFPEKPIDCANPKITQKRWGV